jgi:hypothetical protein
MGAVEVIRFLTCLAYKNAVLLLRDCRPIGIMTGGVPPGSVYVRLEGSRTLTQSPADNAAPPGQEPGPVLALGGLELRLQHAVTTVRTEYAFDGQLSGAGAELFCAGGSLQVQESNTGLAHEVFFTADGRFALSMTLLPETDTPLVLALCDDLGDIVATVPLTLRHRSAALAAGAGDLARPVLARELAIEVRSRNGQHRKQVLAPVGSSLPGRFSTTCRTSDQSGRVVVPLWEADRVLQQVVVTELDPHMPAGSPVEVELQVEPDRAISVRVVVRQAGRSEVVQIPAPPLPCRPLPEEVERLRRRIEKLLPEFTGKFGAALQETYQRERGELDEALESNQDERAAAILARLQEQCDQMELATLQIRYPPLQRLTQLVKRCLFEAANLADRTGRNREQLFAQIYAQEQAAEEAHAEKNVLVYRECFDNLLALAADLERLGEEMLPLSQRDPQRMPSVHDVQDELKNLEAYLAAVLPAAELKERRDFVEQLQALDQRREGLAERGKRDAGAALGETRRALAEVARIDQALGGGRTPTPAQIEGMLEGSS